MRRWIVLVVVGCASSPAPRATPTPPPVVAPTAASWRYPAARRADVVELHHGAAIADPYRWLEDMDSPDTRAWVAAENAVSDGYLARLPGRDKLHARITELLTYEGFGIPVRHGGHAFWLHRAPSQDRAVMMTATDPEAPPTVLLDPNTRTAEHLAFAGQKESASGERVTYGLALAGGDWETWHVRDVATATDLADELPHIKYYAPSFTHDGTGLYYSRFPAPPPGKELVEPDHDHKIYYHRIGTSAAHDRVVYERPDHPSWQFDLEVTDDGRYLVITTGDGQVGDRSQELIGYLDLQHPTARPVPLIDAFDAEYVFIGNDGPTFYVLTALGAATKRIVAIDTRTPDRARWREVVPAGPSAIERATLVGHQLLVTTLEDAHHAVTAYDLRGRRLRDVALPGLGTTYGFVGSADATSTFYRFSSFTTPGAIYRYDLATGTSTLWKAPSLAFDPAQLETRQVFFPSKDGTRVPMFITARRGLPLDGSTPTIMTAYGFGGVANTPTFNAALIAWLERGGAYVVVNVRGGGEYGEAWQLAAARTHHQVGYDDFLAAADWLIDHRYTAPAHLGAIGTSGGGLLVAGAVLQRPERFAAVVPLAGVHDLLRFHLFGQGAGWQGFLGSPDDAAEFAALRATSPLHTVRPGVRYPTMFIVTADHDVRVAPLHSYKLAAALQAAQAGPAPILLRVETVSGHAGGTTRSQVIDQQTDNYAVLANALGLALE